MKKQKVDTKLGVAIIVIFAITTGVLVWIYENGKSKPIQQNQITNNAQQQNQTQEEQGVTINTGELYKNDKFGFEFISPQKLILTSRPADSNVIFSDRPSGHWIYDIRISQNNNNLSLENAFIQELSKHNKSEEKIISTTINIDGILAKRFSIQKYTDYGNSGVVLVNGSNIVTIYGDDSSFINKTNFETIISSFKFMK